MKFVSLCLPFYDVFQNGRVVIWNRKIHLRQLNTSKSECIKDISKML